MPLMWTLLPQEGRSFQQIREELLARFLHCCPERSVSRLKSRPQIYREVVVLVSESTQHCSLYPPAHYGDGWKRQLAPLSML